SDPDAIPIDQISDTDFHSSQISILRERIESYIVPSLNILFRELSPYKNQEKKLKSAFKWLEDKVVQQSPGYETYKITALQNFRSTQIEVDTSVVRDAASEFEELAKRDEENGSKFFYYNVFQQALIRNWINLAKHLTKYELTPIQTANLMIKALNNSFVEKASKILAYDALYVRRMIFTGERVLINERAKTAWTDLVAVSLGSTEGLRLPPKNVLHS
ncbi:MAG: hypothetical protein Q7V20_11090, partial [Aquabacterium sp.]|uniref:hypothetical protein n=1 Tax=Aquabacterium sp. TaxID=1872578 RepID=UPI00271D699A